ncbi:MAG: hypothetical protein COC22_00455 [Flavobacteriaceae bacterium]|nr:MAG: hypothetical protein COC22_00455 [Flavobacteriaceae bacterium]
MFIDGKIFSIQKQGGISRLYYELLRFKNPDRSCTLYRGRYQDSYDWSCISNVQNIGLPRKLNGNFINRLERVTDPIWLEYEWLKAKKVDSTYISTYYRLPSFLSRSHIVVGDYDCVHERFPDLFPGVDKVISTKRRAFSRADLIMTISESSKLDIMKFYGIMEDKIRVFPLGVDAFFDRPLDPKSDLCCSDKPFLLYVGSRAHYKNFSMLQKAFESGLKKHYDLIVVGGGDMMDVEKAPFGHSVSWLSANDAELKDLYQRAAALVYPSRYEGFGLPPLEALCCGCPVVVTDNPVARETLGEHTEYFLWNDLPSFLEAVELAVQHSPKRREAAYNHARTYTWKKSADRFYSQIELSKASL